MTFQTAAVLLCVALAGCASKGDTARNFPKDACTVVAEQRRYDGELNGYDERLQKVTFDYAYADCVRWNMKYGAAH